MAMLPINRNYQEIKTWIEKHHPGWKEPTLPISKCTMYTVTHKFGNGVTRVELCILAIVSAEKDTTYLKSLLKFGYENGYLQHGIFVPTEIYLAMSPEVYKGLLKHQNKFLEILY
eukprot:16619-Ditylum_brightwellii.AAC.1